MEKPFSRSIKKMMAVFFLFNGLGMSWLSFFAANPNDAFSIIALVLGTGLTLLGIKTAGGLIAQKQNLGKQQESSDAMA